MLLDFQANKTETNCDIAGTAFTIQASPIAFEILSSRLYSDAVLAIVRELLTNAYDSQKAVGKETTPIKVQLPTYLEPQFVIRDYGSGLSKEEVMGLYTTFFSSTKSMSNDFTGCFGLGSKTPFAYTSSFSVNSYQNGIKQSFIATKKDSNPHIFPTQEQATEEPDGLEISIPVEKNNADHHVFLRALQKYLRHIPEVITTQEDSLNRGELLLETQNIKLYGDTLGVILKQGQNTYPLTDFLAEGHTTLATFKRYCTVVIEVPIGTLTMTPSREALSKEDKNVKKIAEQLRQADNQLREQFLENVEAFAGITDLQNLYAALMTARYFKGNEKIQRSGLRVDGNKLVCITDRVSFTDIEGSGHTRRVCSGSKNLILLTNKPINRHVKTRIHNTVLNYPHTFQETRTYLTDGKDYSYDTMSGAALIRTGRQLKNLCKLLNSLEGAKFDVEFMTLRKFHRLYPNSRKQVKKVTPTKVLEKSIQANTFGVGGKKKHYNVSTACRTTVGRLKKNYSPQNTCVIFRNTEPLTIPTHTQIDVLEHVSSLIRNPEGTAIVYQYLRKFFPDLRDEDPFYILEIAPSNAKLFKEYVHLPLNNIFRYIDQSHWLLLPPVSRYIKLALQDFEEGFLTAFKPRLRKAIENTPSYQRALKLARFGKRFWGSTRVWDSYTKTKAELLIPSLRYKTQHRGLEHFCTPTVSSLLNMIAGRYYPNNRERIKGALYRHRIKEAWRMPNSIKKDVLELLKGEL